MSARFVSKPSKRPKSTRAKSASPRKSEKCSNCSKTGKGIQTLSCKHAFCQECIKTCPVKKAVRKASAKAKKPGMLSKQEYECIICSTESKSTSSKHGHCVPCKFDKKTSPADGFCVECSELLCQKCCKEHSKFKSIREHHILKGKNIPKDTGAIARLPLIMICIEHTDKQLEYYCAEHDVMGCGACINTSHRRCERVMFIKDIADEPADRNIVADTALELREIRKNFEDVTRDTGDVLDELDRQRNEIRERREVHRKKINELLDRLDKSSEHEMEEVMTAISRDMGSDAASSKELLGQIDSSINVLDAATGHATSIQMFVAGRRCAADREKYINLLTNSMGSIQNVKLEFKPGSTLERLVASLEIFEGRCIKSNSTRYREAGCNNMRSINYRSQSARKTNERVEYEHNRRFLTPHGDRLLPRPNLVTAASVPDIDIAGYRQGHLGLPSLQPYQDDPRNAPHLSRQQPNSYNSPVSKQPQNSQYDRQMQAMYGKLPMISQRGTQSETGFGAYPHNRQDELVVSPRSINDFRSHSLRRTVLNQNTNKEIKEKPVVIPTGIPSRSRQSDILAEASPMKGKSDKNTETPFRERKAVLMGQYNVRLGSDEFICGLKGAAFLSDGRVVLADYDNHCIKLFDSALYRGTYIRLSSGPWDVVVTGAKEFAVSLPFESKIQFITVTDTMKISRTIKMDMDCYGLAYNKQELFVVCNDYLIGPAVQILSMTGRVKQTIDIDRHGQRILLDPYYLTVTPTSKLIYVTDNDRVVCMDRHGNVTSVYQDSSLRTSRGIDLDHEGNIYVCGYMSNNVHQITMHGIDFRCLLTKEQVWDPWSVTFNEINGTLLLTSDSSDMVNIVGLK